MITGPAPAEMFDGIILILTPLTLSCGFLLLIFYPEHCANNFPDTNNLPSKKLFSMATGALTQGRSGGCREGV